LLAAILAPVLAGCDSASLPPAPRQSMTSRFAAGAPDVIETTLVDPLPVRVATLRPANGPAIAALSIDTERNLYSDETGYGPNVDIGVAGGSASPVTTGIGIGFPLFGGGPGSARHTASMTTSTMRFRIPDMAAYRRDWQHWVLHLDLDDGASRRTIETLPPAPPPD
jgi:hypothetical protein